MTHRRPGGQSTSIPAQLHEVSCEHVIGWRMLDHFSENILDITILHIHGTGGPTTVRLLWYHLKPCTYVHVYPKAYQILPSSPVLPLSIVFSFALLSFSRHDVQRLVVREPCIPSRVAIRCSIASAASRQKPAPLDGRRKNRRRFRRQSGSLQ